MSLFFKAASHEEGLKEIQDKLKNLDDNYKIIFINTIPLSQYLDEIFDDIIKFSNDDLENKILNIIKERDEILYSLLNADYDFDSFNIEYNASDSNMYLTKGDESLAYQWATDFRNPFERAKMFSARFAEKATKIFYESLGHKVIDVSLQQVVKDNDGSWKTHDLLVDNHKSIDVKNARTPLNNDRIYVEHTVRKFKQNKSNEDVVIVGVLSHYIKDYYNIPQYDNFIRILGETTLNEISKLEKEFCKDSIIDIKITNAITIPPYLFDYPKEFYKDTDVLREKLRNYFVNISQNTIKYFKLKNINIIAIHLMAGIDLPDILKINLTTHEKNIYGKVLKITKQERISLPNLYLTILTDFLDRALNQNLDDSINYEKIFNISNKYSNFLGIKDPLGLLGILCSTLDQLVKNKESLQMLREFDYFKFSSIGILRGKNRNNNKIMTIFAYCGGFISGKGKCGNNPLIFNRERTCENGFLICPRESCGYCCSVHDVSH